MHNEPDWAAWFEELAPLLLSEALRHLPDWNTAEDAVQETFLRAICKPPPLSIRPWLFAVLRKVCLEHRLRRSHRPVQQLQTSIWEHIRVASGPSRVVQIRELSENLDKALLRLRAVHREVFTRRAEGLEVRTVAAELQLGESNVKRIFSLAKRELKRLLDEHTYSSLVDPGVRRGLAGDWD